MNLGEINVPSTEIKNYWEKFCQANHLDTATNYSAWSYGNSPEMANDLADLTVRGIKTATTSAAELYEFGEPKPYVGEYNIILMVIKNLFVLHERRLLKRYLMI